MEVGDKLKELNMTEDEVDRLAKAFKDENFRKMLHDYAQEISDPENKKKYEEEIKLLEQERGNTIEFVHPTPFKALRTSVDGSQRCYINICANDKVGKPSSSQGVSEEGCRGQYWSLPHNLHPGRQFTDKKGNKFIVYDVIFHPDTLHIARRSKRFMDLVDNTAIQAIQKSFNVSLDSNNLKQMKTKYKGTPQPCVVRKPIPGYKPKEPSDAFDPLAFPYPDEKRPTTSKETNSAELPATKTSAAEPKNIQVQPLKNNGPTQPNYTVKYRSYIDIQDFRCSRDSAQSPRPKEILVTIDMPLLKAVTEASLEIEERRLLLESKTPAYRLELPLAYPVDEEKGEAKFNKQKGQLTVTLPVLPSNETFNFAVEPPQTDVDEEEEIPTVEAESASEGKEGGNLVSGMQDERDTERSEEEDKRDREREKEEMEGGEKSQVEKEIGVEDVAKWEQIHDDSVEEKLKEQKPETEKVLEERQKEEDNLSAQCSNTGENKSDREERDSGATTFQPDAVDSCMDVTAEVISGVASPETENVLINAEHPSCLENEKEEDLNPCFLTTTKIETTPIEEEPKLICETTGANPEVR